MSTTAVNRPRLQLALDEIDLGQARSIAEATAPWVDVLEVGTLLLAACGVGAVAALRADHPSVPIVADLRISRAGEALAELCFQAGATAVTVMAEAPTETRLAAIEVARRHTGTVEIELGDGWTTDELTTWLADGASAVILHREAEAETAGGGWSPADLAMVRTAAATGLDVSVTGGIGVDQLQPFAGEPVATVIAGRSIRRADEPAEAANALRAALDALAAPTR